MIGLRPSFLRQPAPRCSRPRSAVRSLSRALTVVLAALLALVLPAPSAAAQRASGQARAWEHETSDIAVNRRVHFGTLDNGLRWAWMVNGEPKQRCYLRLHVDVGSLAEEDSEQGMAHFLEHMAFNGSEHFPPGTLIEWFQKHKMAFGADTNASTDFSETIYKLDLATSDEATVKDGLTVLSDMAHGLLLQPAEVTAEVGVIDGEERERDSAGFRAAIADLRDQFAGARIGSRIPIGVKSIRAAFSAESVRAFYERWYRPENMTLVIVGDLGAFDPAPLVKELFGAIAAPSDAVAPEPGAGPAAPHKTVYSFFSPELPTVTLSVQMLKPWEDRPGTKATLLRDVPLGYARRMVDLRFQELARKEGAPFLGASLQEAGGLRVLEGEELAVGCKPETWQAALAAGEQELRRALQHGFRQAELDEVRANALRSLDEAVDREGTRPSSSWVNEILGAAEDREVVTDAATDRSLLRPAIEALTVESCHEALVKAWSEGTLRLSAVGGLDLSGPGGKALEDAWKASAEVEVEAPPELATEAFAYASDPDAAGTIASRSRVEDLDVTQVRFDNGVRLNVKRTDFRERQIQVRVRVGQGQLSLPPGQAALSWIGGQAFGACGLAAHSDDELRRLTAGKRVGLGFAVQPDAFQLDQSTTSEDLLLQCELFCAYLMHPGWREEGLREVQQQLGPMFEALAHRPDGPVQLQFLTALHAGDTRFGLPPQDELAGVTTAQLAEWLGPQLAQGALEVTIVGDVDVEASVAAVARTFGVLPARPALPDVSERLAAKVVPGLRQQATIETEVPSSLVVLAFPTTDGRLALRRRQLNLLSLVLSDRLRVEVREKLGAAYSPQAVSQASDVFPGVGLTLVQAGAAPGAEDTVLQACLAAADALARDGVTAEELERQRSPVLARVRDQMRDNSFWRDLLDDCQARPTVLDELRALESDYAGIGVEALGKLARTYFPRERASSIVVSPAAAKPAEAGPETPAGPGDGAPAGPDGGAGRGGAGPGGG